MALPRGREADASLVQRLSVPATPERQLDLLRAEGLLDPQGLERLLDAAEGLVNKDPGTARRLAELCALAAARADYVRARTHFINGEFDAALRMAEAARNGYAALGEDLEALRTDVGRMAVLIEQGRYGEVLSTGDAVLAALKGADTGASGDKIPLRVRPAPRERELLAALVHQNRGGCYEYMGRYDDALDAYTRAEGCYRGLGMVESLAEIYDNRGGVLLALGRGNEALSDHEAAAAIFRDAGMALSYAQSLMNIGEAHLRLGNFKRSLDTFERARETLDALDAPPYDHLLLLNMADAYLELNLYSEALDAYAKVNEWLREAGIEHDRARTLWGMGSALAALSDAGEAERALRGAAEKFAAAGNAPMLCGVLLEQASLLAARKDRAAALATARRALEVVSGKAWPVEEVYAHLRLYDLLPPDTGEAEGHLLEAQRLACRLALPQLRYRLDERLGRLRRLQGRDEEARVLLEAAVDEIERLRDTVVAQEAMRASFLRDKTVAYEELLSLHLARGDEGGARRAFAVAEKAKSRALLELLTGVVERAPGGNPGTAADPESEGRLRRLQADLNATYNRMLGVDGEGPEAPAEGLRERAAGLEREIGRLRLRTVPAPDPFAAPEEAEADVLERLPPGVTLLSYGIVGDEILAFVAADGDVRVARGLGPAAAVSRLLRRLDAQWDRFRVGPEFVARHAAALERSTRGILGELYAALVGPLEPLLEGAAARSASGPPGATASPRELGVVPHGLLHRVPFHALFDGERYLLERFEVSYAPSATVYALCQEKDVGRRPEAALAVSVADDLIPGVTEEARAVARRLPGAEVLDDERATVEALRGSAAGRGVLHMACHGLFRPDNPMFSALKLHDGWLTATDALRLDLTGALVTLSACESGRGEAVGDGEILGLARAFLGAGASTLVASLWLVQDETTGALMEEYYERLRGGSGPAAALRTAQLALKEGFSHPHYWAPFVLVGRR